MKGKLLPLGTVVMLVGGTKKVMITGYYTKENDDSKIYTYNGCVFPEGFMENVFCLFDAPQIKEVLYMGLENEELNKHLEKMTSIDATNRVSAGIEENSVSAQNGKRGKAPKAPNKPFSASEMRAKYTREKISGGQTEKFDFSKLQK